MAKRTIRESSVPAWRLSPWQRYVLEEVWKVRSYVHLGTGEVFYVLPTSKMSGQGPAIEVEPGGGYVFIEGATLTEYQKSQLEPPLDVRVPSQQVGEPAAYDPYYLVQADRLPPPEPPQVKVEPKPRRKPPEPPRPPKPEKPPKAPVLRQASYVDEDGRMRRFDVVKIPPNYARVLDIDGPLPDGYRLPRQVIGRITTDRGVQLLLEPGTPDLPELADLINESDQAYRQLSEHRGSYDVATLNHTKRGGRTLEALGEGRDTIRGHKGRYSANIRAIARALEKGGGRFKR